MPTAAQRVRILDRDLRLIAGQRGSGPGKCDAGGDADGAVPTVAPDDVAGAKVMFAAPGAANTQVHAIAAAGQIDHFVPAMHVAAERAHMILEDPLDVVLTDGQHSRAVDAPIGAQRRFDGAELGPVTGRPLPHRERAAHHVHHRRVVTAAKRFVAGCAGIRCRCHSIRRERPVRTTRRAERPCCLAVGGADPAQAGQRDQQLADEIPALTREPPDEQVLGECHETLAVAFVDRRVLVAEVGDVERGV